MIVALTGGIGSGKTTVGKIFGDLGVPVYNSDEWAKKLMQSEESVREDIIDLLGRSAYNGGQLNRAYISETVFNDKKLLKALNSIVHPGVRRHFLAWANTQEAPYVIQEAAVIFENGSQDFYDKIILVTAPEDVRIARINARDGTSEKDILARMDNQWSDAKKIPLSDYIIANLDLEKTRSEVAKIHKLLLLKAANSKF